MVWWHRPRIDSPTARLAGPTDRPALADLLERAAHFHGVSAVEEQMALLTSGISALALAGDRPTGFLGLRQRTPTGNERWADLALVAVAGSWSVEQALRTLLATSRPALLALGTTGIVCVASDRWLTEALLAAGFRQADRVITYIRNDRPINSHFLTPATLRPAGAAEAAIVLQLNAAAFEPLWRYDEATTLSWLLTSEHSVLAEAGGSPAGFALTSDSTSDGYVQLIRLGTHPRWQGQGIGRQLVVDAINYGHAMKTLGVALNTQYSNAASRHLYESLGFRVVGVPVDVMVCPIGRG